MNYLIVRFKKRSNRLELITLLEGLGKITKIIEQDKMLIIFFDAMIERPDQGLENFASEEMIDLQIFISNNYSLEANQVASLLLKTNFNQTKVYTNKTLYYDLIKHLNKDELKQIVLKKYLTDYQMQDLLKVFIELNQNISQTAKKTYFHRNTIMTKLERFKLDTEYDLRQFKDAYLIYYLIEN